MSNIKKALVCAATVGTAMFATATPEVTDVTMTQSGAGRLVTITYKLTEDAVVTLDVQTNATPNAATGWASIGGEAICNAQGAVWRKVTSADADGNGNYTITWRPDLSWTDEFGNGFKIADGCAKAVVTAWSLDNTPNYMVVDISAAAQPNTQKYYPSVDFLPGGILGNPDYRTGMLVLRKIMAKDVTWMMGSAPAELGRNSAREATLQVTLDANYYIGVFLITQTQWSLVATNSNVAANFQLEGSMRPMENVSYNEIRTSTTQDGNVNYYWPNDPHPRSFFGLLRTKTGIAFDFPSEAQWEFAAHAGHGSGYWGDGSAITNATIDANLSLQARYKNNPSTNTRESGNPDKTAAPNIGGTSIVGSYAPNDWGLYDMLGNLMEWCLDWREDDISSRGGAVNVKLTDPSKNLAGASATARVLRGGSWANTAGECRPAYRNFGGAGNRQSYYGGIRVVCPVGLQ